MPDYSYYEELEDEAYSEAIKTKKKPKKLFLLLYQWICYSTTLILMRTQTPQPDLFFGGFFGKFGGF